MLSWWIQSDLNLRSKEMDNSTGLIVTAGGNRVIKSTVRGSIAACHDFRKWVPSENEICMMVRSPQC
jgi:hypothetical protein